MTPEELSRLLEQLDESSFEDFKKRLNEIEEKTLAQLFEVLGEFDSASGGLKASEANLQKLERLKSRIRGGFLNDKYRAAVSDFIARMESSNQPIIRYAQGIRSTFQPTDRMKVIQQAARQRTLQSLTGQGIRQEVIRPIEDLLSTNIGSGGSKEELRERMVFQVRGSDENLGEIERYSKQITQDAMNQYQRQYLQGASEELGLEFYLYEGTTKTTSRPFCVERSGRYYHIEEIKQWPQSQWDGKIPRTSASTILTYLGGYNCRHIAIPVAASAVPKEVRDRAKEKGYYSES
jgi:DNA polymerase III delta prime subunit